MSHLFHIVQVLDLCIYQFLGRFIGNWFFDRFIDFHETSQVLKGGFIFAAYWWLWFRRGSDQEKCRKAIPAIMSATILAIVITRIVAAVTPFRPRPIYVPYLPHASIPISSLEQWNSFPSDTATYFCALAFGLMVLLPRLRVPIALYTGWICFDRVYLGFHYASDVVAGAVIGVAVVWGVLRAKWLQSIIAPKVITLADSKPNVFYAAAFLITFEMATVFSDIRILERKLVNVTRMLGHHASRAPSSATPNDSLVAFTALLLVIVILVILLSRRTGVHHDHRSLEKNQNSLKAQVGKR